VRELHPPDHRWHGRVLRGIEDATLLRVTDEPIMAKFGLLRHG